MHIITIRLSLANVFLVRGERWIVIDSGAPPPAMAPPSSAPPPATGSPPPTSG